MHTNLQPKKRVKNSKSVITPLIAAMVKSKKQRLTSSKSKPPLLRLCHNSPQWGHHGCHVCWTQVWRCSNSHPDSLPRGTYKARNKTINMRNISWEMKKTKTKTKHNCEEETDWVVLKFTVWSLRMLNCMGESPMQYFLNSVMQLWRHRREGLLSWKRSPPSRIKSTCKQTTLVFTNDSRILIILLTPKAISLPSSTLHSSGSHPWCCTSRCLG